MIKTIFKRVKDRVNDLANSGIAMTSGASAGWLVHRHLQRLDQKHIRELASQLGPGAMEFVRGLMSGSSARTTNCKDCDRYAYGFMLVDDVWLEALTPEEGDECPENAVQPDKPPLYICLHCIEERLGRKLTVDDFNKSLPLNRPVLYAYGKDVVEGPEVEG